jgi:glycosyltransferase involved in cell wall biosynthesis
MTDPTGSARVVYVLNELALGGAQRVVLAQAAGLDRARFAPEVASLELIPNGALGDAFAAAGIPVHRMRTAREPLWRIAPRLVDCLRHRAPDIVHTHLAAAGVAGRIAARRVGVAHVVTTLHNLSDWEERRAHPIRQLERRTLHLADAVIAVSDAVRMALVKTSPALAARAVTVRNGVDAATFHLAAAERASARVTLGYGPDHFVVGAVARLDRRKGLDTLIEAIAQAAEDLPRVRLLIVGDGEERARLERQVAERGMSSHVHWAGHRTDVRPYLAAMNLFAAPSRSEGLGVAIIEALAAGLPVFGARVGGIPELLEGAACSSLLPAEHPSVWADAIVALAGAPARLATMAKLAPAHAARFSNAASVASLERVYGRLLLEGADMLVEAA